jgi:hypothetical protein
MRAVFEPLFVTYGVNVVFAGHDHIYERLTPRARHDREQWGGVRRGPIAPGRAIRWMSADVMSDKPC